MHAGHLQRPRGMIAAAHVPLRWAMAGTATVLAAVAAAAAVTLASVAAVAAAAAVTLATVAAVAAVAAVTLAAVTLAAAPRTATRNTLARYVRRLCPPICSIS